MLEEDLWAQSVRWLEGELPDRDVNTWLRPLQAVLEDGRLLLLAPNRLVLQRVRDQFLAHIERAVQVVGGESVTVQGPVEDVDVALAVAEDQRVAGLFLSDQLS